MYLQGDFIFELIEMQDLDLDGCRWDSQSTFNVSKMVALKSLSIRDTLVSDLSSLPLLGHLKELYISSCHRIKDISPMLKCEHLEYIDTHFNLQISHEEWDAVSKQVKKQFNKKQK